MKYLLLYLFFICNSYSGFAQGYDPDIIWVEDPLCKPEIWQKLILEPRNNELWTLYVGKKQEMMSYKELSNLWLWKQTLILRESENTTPNINYGDENNVTDFSNNEEDFHDIMKQIEKAKKEKREKAKKEKREKAKKEKLNTKPKIKNKTEEKQF